MQKETTWLKTQYFAHRGLFDNQSRPENSMAAFHHAVELHFDIECDIRMTKDKELIVFHDKTLKRMCHQEGAVHVLNYSDLSQCHLLNTTETIPLLKDLLDTLPNDTYLLIELKPHNRPKEMVSVFLDLMKDYSFTYAIHSFDPMILYYFKKFKPSIIRGQISSCFRNKSSIKHFLLKHMVFNVFTRPDFINYQIEDLPRKRLDKLKEKGVIILAYSARSESDLAFMKDRYDNAVFEHFIPKK